jgi:hypothetical protein
MARKSSLAFSKRENGRNGTLSPCRQTFGDKDEKHTLACNHLPPHVGIGRYRTHDIISPPLLTTLSPFAPNISVLAILKLTVLEIAMDPTIWMRSFLFLRHQWQLQALPGVGDRGLDGKESFSFSHIRREE